MHQPRRHIKTTSHTPRVRTNQTVKSWHVKNRCKLLNPTIDLGPGESEEPTLRNEYLAPGHLLVESGLLKRHADQEAEIARMLDHIEPADPRAAGSGRKEGGEHANHR